jgi:tRNA (cytidine/uridine-2'-O-)-methyltransferase
MQLALYQPEIPQNTGTLLRMSACLDIPVNIIEPCGFLFNSPKFKRSAMDYLNHVQVMLHNSWDDFFSLNKGKNRLVLLTPHTHNSFYDFTFEEDDILILGQESCGVPENVMQEVDVCLCIPMKNEMRSLNVAIAGAMVVSEACRQLKNKE